MTGPMYIELILAIVVPLMLVLACAWLRFGLNSQAEWNWLPTCLLGIVTLGSVFGHDFFHVSVGPLPITLDRLLLGFSLLLFGWRFLCSRETMSPLNRMDVAILVWLAVITVSTLTAKFTVMDNLPLSRMLFFNWVPAILYFVTRHTRYSAADLKMVTLVLGLFGGYLALTAIAEVRSLDVLVYPNYIMDSSVREFFGRGRGPFLNPVANGTFLIVCMCCILSWWPSNSNRGKFLIAMAALVVCIGVYATLTRSNWIALVAGLAWFVFLPAHRQAKGGMLIAATLAGIVLLPVVAEKVFSFKRDQDVSVEDMEKSAQLRPMFAKIAWDMFQDRPLVGVGFGQYTQYKKPYLRDVATDKPLILTKPFMQHNVFLAYATELGLVGLGALAWLLMQSARVGWQVWSNVNLRLEARQHGLILLVFLSCYCINGMFHDTSIVPQMHILFMFLLGITNNIYSRHVSFQQESDEESVLLQIAGLPPSHRNAA